MSGEEIRFGTEGWRATIGRDFNLENVARLAAALGLHLLNRGQGDLGAAVAHDTRTMSEEAAFTAAGQLAGLGIPVLLIPPPTPTPVLSFTVADRGAAAGMVITASHNPAIYNGVKMKGPEGGPAQKELLSGVQSKIGSARPAHLSAEPMPPPTADTGVVEVDPLPRYLDRLGQLVDLDAIRQSRLEVVVDAMNGAASGYLPRVLGGHRFKVAEIRGSRKLRPQDPPPEPIQRNLRRLRRSVRKRRGVIGLALDGDGDRLGVVAPSGRFVTAHEVLTLLLRHLVEVRGDTGPVGKTISTSRMVNRLAQRYGLPVFETPVGFKHLSPLFAEQNLLIAGEESGGLAVRGHIPERDGILAALLLLEALVRSGRHLDAMLEDLEKLVGSLHYQRLDLQIGPQLQEQGVLSLLSRLPRRIAGLRVMDIDPRDGLKLLLEKDNWLLVRISGTEPLVRLYCEAASMRGLEAILADARRLLDLPGR